MDGLPILPFYRVSWRLQLEGGSFLERSKEAPDAAAVKALVASIGGGAHAREFRVEFVAEGRRVGRFTEARHVALWDGVGLPPAARRSEHRTELVAGERSLDSTENVRAAVLAAVEARAIGLIDAEAVLLRFEAAVTAELGGWVSV